MARTRSSYTASPERRPSPRRSPARRPSNDGSEYEMDLDALGLNSTFESSELQGAQEPPVDRIETSEIEGPEDFTMNMTYWMTADLPLAQIKSRKEAKGRIEEARMDAMHEVHAHDSYEEAQNTMPPSEPTMEHEEKVRSFLSALPDTDMDSAIAGTPLHKAHASFLQVPHQSPPKARSLQPTVEDYDTPRKPTQETVIHHAAADLEEKLQDALETENTVLRSRLEQQELTSKTRITELETILAYTKSELDAARSDVYKQGDRIRALEDGVAQHEVDRAQQRSSMEAQITAAKTASNTTLNELAEEMRLQHMTRLDKQREDFELGLQSLEESKHTLEQNLKTKDGLLSRAQAEVAQLKVENNHLINDATSKTEREIPIESASPTLSDKLSSVQERAEALQTALEAATADARSARVEADNKSAVHAKTQADLLAKSSKVIELQNNLQTTKFDLECAQTDVAAKQQLFETNLHLNETVRRLRNELETARTNTSSTQSDNQAIDYEKRTAALQRQYEASQRDLAEKDQQILVLVRQQEDLEERLNTAQGRVDGLDATVTSIRQQLAQAHRDTAKARTDAERHERDLEDANERLQDAQAETDRRIVDMNRKLNTLKQSKTEAERKYQEIQSSLADLIEGHEAMLEDVRDKAEDAVRKAGALLEQERTEKRRIMKDLKRTKSDLERIQTAHTQQQEEIDSSDEEVSSVISTSKSGEKDEEIASLREIIRKQIVEKKTLQTKITTSQREVKELKLSAESHTDLLSTISTLESENASLKTSLEDQEAVNEAMDEKLATLLSKLMKERTKRVVGKRDDQWLESVAQVADDREMMGKVLLRQWGREEVGITEEKGGQKQMYRYKYVK